jgi:hypothetical protein
MTNSIKKKLAYTICIFAAMVLFGLAIHGAIPDCENENGVDFRIVADNLSYAPGATLRVKFLVTNTGEEPLYLFRLLSDCSSQIGGYLFFILDQNNKEVPIQRCAADLIMDDRVIDELSDPKFGIALRKYDIYGFQGEFQLPAKKGIYQLKAELWPPGFTDKQKEILSQRQMRVLRSRCLAPIVTITIK